MWWYFPIIPAHGTWRWDYQQFKAHRKLPIKFKASLDYMELSGFRWIYSRKLQFAK